MQRHSLHCSLWAVYVCSKLNYFFIKINAVLHQCYPNTYPNNPLYYTFVLLCRLLPLHKGSLRLRVGDWCKCETSFDSWYLLHNFHYSNSNLRMNQKNSKTHELFCNYMRICIRSECGIQIFWRVFHCYSKTINLT